MELLQQNFRPGLMYKKASVMLLDMRPAEAVQSQGLLFDMDEKTPEKRKQEVELMNSVDQINHKLGRGTVFFGAAGLGNRWHSTSDHSSPFYTSDWEQLPIARVK